MILRAAVIKSATIRLPIVSTRLSPILGWPLSISFLDLSFAGVYILIIGSRLHLCSICSCSDLLDFALLLGALDLNQDFGEHFVDSVQSDVGAPHLVLVMQAVPHAYCLMVVDDGTQPHGDKRNQCPRMNILFGLDAEVEPVLHRFQPCRASVEGGTFGGASISFCMVASLTSGGTMSCFMMYQMISSATDLGMASKLIRWTFL